uniref:Zgc:165604 n=1 Tax=Cynoglossus semilaevis TaxID=244447 RepID=A0A3P8VJD9_CYNSE
LICTLMSGFLDSCLFSDSAALTVTMRENSVEAVRGDSVLLGCSFLTSTPLHRLNIVWTLVPSSSPESPMQVIVFDHGQVMEDPSLTGRVSFTGLPWTADIVLNDTRVSDSGVYRCMVNNPPEAAEEDVGEVVLTVLAPPSLPVCQWTGDVDVGGQVTLSCSVMEGVPTPEIHWEKVSPEEVPLPVDMEGDLLSASVQIANVSSQTSGQYRCSASNLLGTESCLVRLSVHTPADTHKSSGVLQGVLLTMSMSALLMALVLLLLWLHRTGQDFRRRGGRRRRRERKGLRFSASVMKRSFV